MYPILYWYKRFRIFQIVYVTHLMHKSMRLIELQYYKNNPTLPKQ